MLRNRSVLLIDMIYSNVSKLMKVNTEFKQSYISLNSVLINQPYGVTY